MEGGEGETSSTGRGGGFGAWHICIGVGSDIGAVLCFFREKVYL